MPGSGCHRARPVQSAGEGKYDVASNDSDYPSQKHHVDANGAGDPDEQYEDVKEADQDDEEYEEEDQDADAKGESEPEEDDDIEDEDDAEEEGKLEEKEEEEEEEEEEGEVIVQEAVEGANGYDGAPGDGKTDGNNENTIDARSTMDPDERIDIEMEDADVDDIVVPPQTFQPPVAPVPRQRQTRDWVVEQAVQHEAEQQAAQQRAQQAAQQALQQAEQQAAQQRAQQAEQQAVQHAGQNFQGGLDGIMMALERMVRASRMQAQLQAEMIESQMAFYQAILQHRGPR